MEDKLLLIRCKQADRQALRRIYEKYRDHLMILAVALCHDINIAEDAVHDAFVSFARGMGRLKIRSNLKGYLSAAVANRVRDLLRSRGRSELALEDADEHCSSEPGPAQRIICNEKLQKLNAALAQLPYEQREVIALRIHGQMRFRQIAKSLEVSTNTAKSRYRYAIEKLRSILVSEVEL
jgi:RNA polymerase sigma-70 factor (ECF subfamily)